jgi:hypothetical protein
MDFLKLIWEWSEGWAMLIPLLAIFIFRPKGRHVWLLITYVIIAFAVNFFAQLVLQCYYLFPDNFSNSNNIYYNIHVVVRVLILGWYIISVRPYKYHVLLNALLILFIAFTLINFTFFESPLLLSIRLFAAGNITLIICCVSYFLRSILEDSTVNWLKHPSFIVCTAVCLYEAVTFFIFLFIYPLSYTDPEFGLVTLRIYQVILVLFGILLAIALYRYRKQKPSANELPARS